MELQKINGFWVWKGDYSSRHIPKAAKFRWNSDSNPKYKPNLEIPLNHWWTDNIELASKLIDHIKDESLKQEIQTYLDNVQNKIKDSIATDSDLDIPSPEGLDYYGYQKAGIAYGYQNKNVLIADEMGLGKTIQSIGLLNLIKSVKKVLIVCPASLKINWKRELDSWLVRDLSYRIVSSKDTKPVKADILIINYDILHSKKVAWIHRRKYHMIIADEAHYVKNNKAKRSEAFYKLANKTDRKIMLTGTPILNKPIEIFNIINCLGFPMNWWAFTERYCNPKATAFGRDVSGASNLEELQIKLRSTIMVRRMKSDVLHELPPKRRQIIELDPTKYKDYIDAEQEYLQTLKNSFGFKKDEDEFSFIDYEDRVDTLKSFKVSHIAEMARLRHNTALAKVPDVIEHIKRVLDEVDKVIVFAHHRDVIDGIYSEFESMAVKHYGGMSEDNKNKSVEEFQNNEKIRLFVGSIKASGVGLTLTKANTVIFAELDWTPANLSQAEDRAHRIGQSDSVLVQHIVVDGSIDSNLAKKVVSKQNVIDKAINSSNILDYSDKTVENIKIAQKRTEKEQKIEKSKQLMMKFPNAGEMEYSPAQIKAILMDLRRLCDMKDILSVTDKPIAYLLSSKRYLTTTQAMMGEEMIKKYANHLMI